MQNKHAISTLRTTIRLLSLGLFILLVILGKFQLWLLVYAGGIIASLFFGRIYCAYVCPMHTVMGPVGNISRKIGLQRKKIPSWLTDPKLAFALLVLSVGSMIFVKRIFSVQVPVLPILFALSIVVTLFLPDAVWHKGLCPYSVLLRISARFSRFSRAVDAHSCTRTHKCLKVCPAGAITMDGPQKSARIDKSLCLQCELCTDICPRSAISFGRLKNL